MAATLAARLHAYLNEASTMRMSRMIVVVSIAGVCVAGRALVAEHEVFAMCCSDQRDCISGGLCCDPESMGVEPCAQDAPGYCQAVCSPMNGGR